MDPPQFNTMANKFQSVLDASVLDERGRQLEFSKRERLITPFRFGLSMVASMATEQVVSIADLHHQFNDRLMCSCGKTPHGGQINVSEALEQLRQD